MIDIAKSYAEKFHLKNINKKDFIMFSDLYAIKYPSTADWQKTVGMHNVWAQAYVNYSSNTFTMEITIFEKDLWNFNRGMSDIETGTPDNVNGRFAELGWAKEFWTYGSLTKKISWHS